MAFIGFELLICFKATREICSKPMRNFGVIIADVTVDVLYMQ